MAQLRRLVVFRVTKVEVQAEANEARACLRFNEPIATKSDISYSAFVRAEPKLDGIVTARGDTLCLDGLKHGGVYNVEILAGLPAATGETMPATYTTRVVVPDRKKSIRFSGAGYVLPRQETAGLPLTTINVDKVKLRLLRVNERNLVPEHRRRPADDELLALGGRRGHQPQRQPASGKARWRSPASVTAP